MKQIAMVCLIVVIVGSLGYTGWRMFARGGDMARAPDHFVMKCTACQAEWDMPKAQYAEYIRKLQQPTGPSPAVDCPKCLRPASAYIMAQCPACRKHYLSPGVTDLAGVMSGRVRIVCPHCQADIQKYYNRR